MFEPVNYSLVKILWLPFFILKKKEVIFVLVDIEKENQKLGGGVAGYFSFYRQMARVCTIFFDGRK